MTKVGADGSPLAPLSRESSSDKTFIENGNRLALKFGLDGLIPVVATCAETGDLLMQAWMNEEALVKTLTSGEVHYWSRSRQTLWHKGATSGQIQKLVELRTDCDQDSLWLKVHQMGGGCCHVGHPTCFYRRVDLEGISSSNTVNLLFTESHQAD